MVHPDGRVFASDSNAAVTEILPDGSLRSLGRAGGSPNGINVTLDGGGIVIANFAGHALQRVELATGHVVTLCDVVEGRPLRFANYPIVATDGTIYCTSSTQQDDEIVALVDGVADGYIFRVTNAGVVEVVAQDLVFPNGLAFDADESYLYCARTAPGDVVRFPVLRDGRLGPQQPFGPPLGTRTEYGIAATRAVWPGGRADQSAATADLSVLLRWGGTDGCAFDVDGNLWVTVPGLNRIVAITPTEEVVVIVDDPDSSVLVTPTNISFGGDDGRDVYIGSVFAPHVVRARSSIPGLPLAGHVRARSQGSESRTAVTSRAHRD